MIKPIPSSQNVHFQNEAKRKTFLVKVIFLSVRITNHFHVIGFALSTPTWNNVDHLGKNCSSVWAAVEEFELRFKCLVLQVSRKSTTLERFVCPYRNVLIYIFSKINLLYTDSFLCPASNEFTSFVNLSFRTLVLTRALCMTWKPNRNIEWPF